MTDIHWLGLVEIAQRIQARELSSVDVTRALLDRIDSLAGRTRAFVTVMHERALAEAACADEEIGKGLIRGALHGVPLAIKDLFCTVDAPTTHGMPINRGFLAGTDATALQRLRAAGAVILGKLQQTEGAFAQHHPDVAPPLNPWDSALWPGVSSSGSGVATAAGLCFGALGTDTGGSIRFPSAANGITGLKPTWGRVSRAGAMELAGSMDHIGPMARSAADAAAILFAIAGADPLDPTASQRAVPDYLALMTKGLEGLRIGIDRAWAIDRVDADTRRALEGVLALVPQLGGTVVPVQFPDTDQAARDWAPLCAVETAIAHETTFPARREEYGPALAGLIDLGRQTNAMDHQRRLTRRADLRGRINTIFREVDLVLAPVTAPCALTPDEMTRLAGSPETETGIMGYTAPFDLSGHPTITLPGGFTEAGAPIGFQFVAAHFGETELFRAGWAYQSATDWHLRRPDLSE
jgi:amidase